MDTSRVDEIPWRAWLGGAVGASYVVSTVVAAPRLGCPEPLRRGDLGQLVCSVLLDQFGVPTVSTI